MVGWLRARIPDLRLDRVADPRRQHRQKWSLKGLLGVVVVGLLAGSKSAADVEALTAEMSPAARRTLRIRGRVPDTTLRDALVRIEPGGLRAALARIVRAAHRRHALEPMALPWGVVSMDGKSTTLRAWDHDLAQQQGSHGVVRTITATLVSSAARVCLDAHPIPAQTNEMGAFREALQALLDAYSGIDLFRTVMYDAGGCSQANAAFVREKGLHYVMVLNDSQPTLAAEAKRCLGSLGDCEAAVVVDDRQQRVRYALWLTEDLAGLLDWDHLRTVVRIRRQVLDAHGQARHEGERYFVTSRPAAALQAGQWVTLLRARWGVESTHHTLDTVFAEDDQPWFPTSPRGTLTVILLRRIAYTLIALFRGHSLRGELARLTPWRDIIRWTYNALLTATEATVANLRSRRPP